MKNIKKKKAFTLVELLIVLAVIAILFVVYISKVGFATDKAKLVGVQTDFRSFYIATKAVQMECSTADIDTKEKFETALNKNLDETLRFTSGINNTVDPWGYHYQYTYDNSDDKISVMYIAETGGAQTIYYSAENFSKSLASNPLDGKIAYGAGITTKGLTELDSTTKNNLLGDAKETEKVELESIAVTTNPTKVGYIEGEDFNPAGMVVSATYSDHSTSIITTYSLNNSTNLSSSQTSVQVEYQGKTADVPVTVTAKKITSIAVTTPPTKTSYIEGEEFNPAGMVVTVTYDNGTSEAVTGYVVQDGTSLTASQTTVSIVYGDKSTTTPITVTAKQLLSIAVTTQPTKTTYSAGENFDPAGMVVTATYNNGTSEIITGYTIDNGTGLTDGQTSVTVTYNVKNTTVPITVSTSYNLTDFYIYTDDTATTGGWSIALNSDFADALNANSSYKNWVIGSPLPNPGSVYQSKPVTNTQFMFTFITNTNLTLDLSKFDTSNVKIMQRMFSNCKAASLNLSGFNTSNVTEMQAMFYGVPATSLDLSMFDTSNVTNMERMFSGAQATTINVSNFNTGKVTNMFAMFENSKASTLDLSSFDTSAVTDTYVGQMFKNAIATTGYGRTSVDVAKFNRSSEKPYRLMFEVK